MSRRHLLATDFQPDFGLDWKPIPPKSELVTWDTERIRRYEAARKEAETANELNPVMFGWRLDSWKQVMELWKSYQTHVILGGNRSTKSTLASRLCVWAACTIPEAEVRCYHVNDKRSVDDQQRFIWEAMPQFLKDLPTKKGINHSITYSQKNGFTDGKVIFPPVKGYRRGGSITFGNYKQYQQDAQVAEGFKSHLIWLDEEAPQKLFETLLSRLIDYEGRLLLTFTTLSGWTSLVQDILGKTKTIKKKRATLLPQDVPVLQESQSRKNTAIHYFWTEHNPFIPTKTFLNDLKDRPKETILARAYGIPTKSIAGAFPKFDKDIMVIPHKEMPWIKNPDYPVMRYMAIDPAGSKSWFSGWVAVDAANTWWVYREWPDISYGEWALPGATAEGKPGPAQAGSIKGVDGYVTLFRQLEDGEKIEERFIDPRFGATERHTKEGATTIISDLDALDFTVIPAPGVDIDNGLQRLTNLMEYDLTKPMGSLNAPRIYISDRCENIIFALSEYTAKGGSEEATKDPIDCFDPETEILTEDGWVKFPELRKGCPVATLSEDEHLEFQVPTEYHDREYTGPMVTASSQSINFMVTPNHRMLVYPQVYPKRFRLAKDLCRQDTIPIASKGLRYGVIPNIEIWPSKTVSALDWAEFIGWYVSEGSATGTNGGKIQMPGRGYSVYISQKKEVNPEKCARIEALLDRLGFVWNYNSGLSYAISSKNLWEKLFPLGNQYHRYIPREVLNLPRQCLEVLWEALVLGDGWREGGYGHYASVSAALINDVTEVLCRLGRAPSSLYVRNPGDNGTVGGRVIRGTVPLFMISEKKHTRGSLTTGDKRMLVGSEDYAGRVYCVSVPNGVILVRRGGKQMFVGNCLRYLAVSNIQYYDERKTKLADDRTGCY